MTTGPRPSALHGAVDALLPLVRQPARYLGTEIGVARRSWAEPRVRWLLIMPDLYEIGMSHQGLRILYDILNRRDDALAERAFAPWIDMEREMRRAGVPLFALESRRPARDFDVIGFSLQYELLATNVLNLLDLAGVPLRSADRAPSDPLIAAGGPCTGNPEPLADFVDFFLIGDGEQMVGRINETLAALRGAPREERLLALAQLPGVYVPRFYEPIHEQGRQVGVRPTAAVPHPVRRTFVSDLDAVPYPERPVVPLIEAVQDRLTLEIQRGCTQGCRFCQAGIFYRPVRERSPATLVDLIASGLPATGWSEISLSSLSTADYSQIEPLARLLTDALAEKRIGLSFSSLRVDTFSVQLAELVARVRKTGFTFAPEAGTTRLRSVINKRVTDEDLLASVEAAYAKGWRRVKLYFMIGLPTETETDLEGIAALTARIRAIGKRHGGANRVTVSVGGFVPKAHTPFQWEPFDGRERLHEKIAYLKERVESRWSPLRWHDPDVSLIEALLSRGDRRAGAAIEAAWRAGGRFDGWTEQFDLERWMSAFRAAGLDPDDASRPLDPAAGLPWDHIDLGVEKRWLLAERKRAGRGESTADCRDGSCTACGLGCGAQRAHAEPPEPARWDRLRDRLLHAMEDPARAAADGREAPIPVRVTYAKTGRLRFISHLETGRLLTRVLRMARWPLAFTRGHHPHPKISYGPPLPLGVEGEQELIDVHLTGPLTDALIEAANARAPEGLRLRSSRALPPRTASLTAAAVTAEHRVLLPADLAAQARREGRIDAFEAARAWPALKAGKGRQKTIDLKRCVTRLAWEEAGAYESASAFARNDPIEPALEDASQPSAVLRLDLRLQEPAGHVLGPLPALREILKWTDRDLGRCRVMRLRVLDERGDALV